jgi:outer membrane protein
MKTSQLGALLVVAAAASFGPGSAFADDPPNDLRIGSYSIFYHTRADDLSGPYVPAGVSFKAENLETLYGAYVRQLPVNFQIELAVGYPPLAKVKGIFPPILSQYNGQVVSSARWIAPTLLLEYNFLDATAPLRPFIGAGINYTTFYDRDSTATGNAATGGPTRISSTASVGPAVTAGLTYRISNRWHAHASYSFSQVKTNLTADTDGFLRTTRISYGPQALIVSVGYSF